MYNITKETVLGKCFAFFPHFCEMVLCEIYKTKKGKSQVSMNKIYLKYEKAKKCFV